MTNASKAYVGSYPDGYPLGESHKRRGLAHIYCSESAYIGFTLRATGVSQKPILDSILTVTPRESS